MAKVHPDLSIVNQDVGPENIAVCIALPTDSESFSWYLNKPVENGDYLRPLRAKKDGSDVSLFKHEYKDVALHLKRLIHNLEEADVEVYCNVTQDTLKIASLRSDVLIFCGHWKGHQFTYWDFLEPPIIVFERLLAAEDKLIRNLVNTIQYEHPNLNKELMRDVDGAVPRLRSALNHSLNYIPSLNVPSAMNLNALIESEPAALRERIDLLLHRAVLPGNRFELYDRFVDAYEFANSLQNDRESILDLAICTSDHPARAIRRERPFIQPITANNYKHPLGWPSLIEATVRILSKSRMPYWTARKLAKELLIDISKEIN